MRLEKKKLILFNPSSLHDFSDYGIGIPLLNQRTLQALEELEDLKEYVGSFENNLDLDDLRIIHNDSFIDGAKTNPEEIVEQAYELIDSEGNYNRYAPNEAKKPLTDFIAKALLHVSGTYQASKIALENGFCYHMGGGMHHSMSHRPGGFCLFNDMAFSLRKLISERKISNAIIIDLDAHKGDGSANITEKDENIDTLSIHMAEGWPLNDANSPESKVLSTFDYPIKLEDDYLSILGDALSKIRDSYDLAIVVHGADAYEKDSLESSNQIQLSLEEMAERDEKVFSFLKDHGVPQAWVMGGGYGNSVYKIYTQFIRFVESSLRELESSS